MELTHASFFSGVGGLDRGLERAGWRTVSLSEIDPYANAVLAERYPGIPNLGCIVGLAAGDPHFDRLVDDKLVCPDPSDRRPEELVSAGRAGDSAWQQATLWSGGFPCQDLSVAGKRAGFAGERSSLAFAFLDLVERHRPPAILLENVPGLLSSHKGRDFGTLLDRLAQLGYWWAYRILDAQHFGVPQRRRRVFIVALHAGAGFGADSAAAVLSVGTRCERHLAAGVEAGEGVASRTESSIAGSLSASMERSAHNGQDDHNEFLVPVRPPPDPGGNGTADGLAGRLDDRDGLAATLNSGGNSGGFRTEPGEHLTISPTLRVGPQRPQDGGPGDTVPITLSPATERDAAGLEPDADPLLPLGLDSHRYRCCGNGVVSNVAEWVGVRLARAVA